MTLPVYTTRITVLRPDTSGNVERYDPQVLTEVAMGVRANIGAPSGRQGFPEGQSVAQHHLTCDPCDLGPTDYVRDEQTAQVYTVAWVRPRVGLGLDHLEAGLSSVEAA